MTSYSTLEDNIYNSTKLFFPDDTVIFSHQGGEEPLGSYIAMQILKDDQIGREDESTYATGSDPDYSLNMTSQYEVVVRYYFVGAEAGNFSKYFENILQSSTARFNFFPYNLSLIRKSDIRDNPSKRDTTWVPVKHLDITFAYAIRTDPPVDIIEDVVWDGTITP